MLSYRCSCCGCGAVNGNDDGVNMINDDEEYTDIDITLYISFASRQINTRREEKRRAQMKVETVRDAITVRRRPSVCERMMNG